MREARGHAGAAEPSLIGHRTWPSWSSTDGYLIRSERTALQGRGPRRAADRSLAAR